MGDVVKFSESGYEVHSVVPITVREWSRQGGAQAKKQDDIIIPSATLGKMTQGRHED